jgi:hypothetical protein
VRWEQGRPAIDAMIGGGALERVSANRDHAELLLRQARAHVAAGTVIVPIDPVGAYQLLYDGARKALTAVLENQGIRPTSRGGHLAVYEAVVAQLEPPLGRVLRPFDRMRRRRNEAEYPTNDSPALTGEDVLRDAPKVEALIDVAHRVVAEMAPY